MKLEASEQAVTRPTAEAIKYGDEIINAIEMADKFREEVEQYRVAL